MFHQLIENFLTQEECEYFIDKGIHHGLIDMKSSKIVNGIVYNENVSDTKNNKRRGTYFVDDTLKESELRTLTDKILRTLNEIKIFKGVEYDNVPKYSFNEYSPGDFLTWHKDSHEIMYGATITLIVQLNDDYDGADVKYKIDELEYTVPKKQGSVFVFDSNIDHCVTDLINGKRYSMNVWPSKKIKKGLI